MLETVIEIHGKQQLSPMVDATTSMMESTLFISFKPPPPNLQNQILIAAFLSGCIVYLQIRGLAPALHMLRLNSEAGQGLLGVIDTDRSTLREKGSVGKELGRRS